MKTICIIFLLFAVHPGFAQQDFLPGYIVTNNNDTIYGLVRDRNTKPFNRQLYEKIRFKSTEKSKRKYKPSELKAYKRGNDLFESWSIEKADSKLFDYTVTPNEGNRKFLKVYASGYLSFYLLEFMEQENNHFDATPLFKREDETIFAYNRISSFNSTRTKLVNYFKDCSELAEMIENKKIKDSVEILTFYNQWHSEQ